ncbi:MAG: TolC family protein [Magnetovibrionaceae bacterium]
MTFRSVVFAAMGAVLLPVASRAEPLPLLLDELVIEHKRIKAAEANLKAAEESRSEAFGAWFPDFTATADVGNEQQSKPNAENFDAWGRSASLTFDYVLYDFGAREATIDSADQTVKQSELTLVDTRQALILEGITAYLEVLRAKKLADFAKGSEENIKRQLDLEDARVQRGSGFSTDVLQAKRNLAGAQALRVRNQGQLRSALNRFSAVFGSPPEDISKLKAPRLPVELLPETLDGVIAEALKNNPALRASRMSVAIAKSSVRETLASNLLPELSLDGELSVEDDKGGTTGFKSTKAITATLTYEFNAALTAINTLKASRRTLEATQLQVSDSEDLLIESARNAWDGYQTAAENADLLENQANIASEFLELAREERNLGRRTLIDVLDGETQLINATSDAESARTDVQLAVYRLLAVMGRLNTGIFATPVMAPAGQPEAPMAPDAAPLSPVDEQPLSPSMEDPANSDPAEIPEAVPFEEPDTTFSPPPLPEQQAFRPVEAVAADVPALPRALEPQARPSAPLAIEPVNPDAFFSNEPPLGWQTVSPR